MSYPSTRTQRRPNTSAPTDGSRTIILAPAQPREEDHDDSSAGPSGLSQPGVGTLKLRGANRQNRQRVGWSDDVVDNEGCGRKSSKVCCIYHKPRAFDESSSEEDSDSDTDSDSSTRGQKRKHKHKHNHDHERQREDAVVGSSGVHKNSDERNAYETVPSSKKGKGKAVG